jgi:hypothetical protein
MCIKINKIGKQEVGIWWVEKHFPRYGVPIWSLWPNIRFLPSIVTEKNVTNAILWETFLNPSDSYFLFADFVDFYTQWTYMLIFRHIFLSNYRKMRRKMCIYKCMLNVYKNQQNRQTGSRNLMGRKTLPTIWGTYIFTSVHPRYFSSHFSQ